ncbi:hypothetical protein HPP92_012345 [Vanilla planifolia]|uniref:Phenylalanine--tRNA ligase beta subunit B1 domain-containing protein n=1 Tax=Vanilla planifolia TaxID=51239 RepID=A0A835UZK4_VANPL|nr:hypothetical protein HPP92_012345 [Vanilla planifolia]
MPTVSVGRDRFFQVLGRSFIQEEFEDLCFEFGIELDDVTTEKEIIRKETHLEAEGVGEGDEEVIYKIEVVANRYDLLCLEGIARALRIFIGKENIPIYRCRDTPFLSMLQMNVCEATKEIRPYVVCAVLRGISFDKANYSSFIDLQDKLHQNICRKRSIVAIGTHDLDTIEGPFTYEAKSFRADELVEFYRSDLKLKKFLHIIENSPVTMFSEYCDTKFEFEPVKVVYPDYRQTEDCASEGPFKGQNIYPDLAVKVIPLLNKMQLQAEEKSNAGNSIITIFEAGDVVVLDERCDVGALNNRQLAALYCNVTSGFEADWCKLLFIQSPRRPPLRDLIRTSCRARYEVQGRVFLGVEEEWLEHGQLKQA